MSLLTESDAGLYCPAGDFYVDPWQPVDRAVITHAHADHARSGSRRYLAAKEGEAVFRLRLGDEADIEFLEYGRQIQWNGVNVALHPAGHIRGSAQVRIEHRGEICVVSGDYKLAADPTTRPFEPIGCHTFVTESTFGLPIYRWPSPKEVIEEIHRWWRENQSAGRTSVLFAYAVGKSQRLLASLDPSVGPLLAHGAVLRGCQAYRNSGCALPEVGRVLDKNRGYDWSQALVIAPPSARGSAWLRRFGDVSLATASGWMRVRGVRRRRSLDRGFVLSDHADWQELNQAVEAAEAEKIWITHGYTTQFRDHLSEKNLRAKALAMPIRSGEDEQLQEPGEEELA